MFACALLPLLSDERVLVQEWQTKSSKFKSVWRDILAIVCRYSAGRQAGRHASKRASFTRSPFAPTTLGGQMAANEPELVSLGPVSPAQRSARQFVRRRPMQTQTQQQKLVWRLDLRAQVIWQRLSSRRHSAGWHANRLAARPLEQMLTIYRHSCSSVFVRSLARLAKSWP